MTWEPGGQSARRADWSFHAIVLECRICSQTTLRADQVCISTNSLNTRITAADWAAYMPRIERECYDESAPEHRSRDEHKPEQKSSKRIVFRSQISEARKEYKQERTTNPQDLQEEPCANPTRLGIKS